MTCIEPYQLSASDVRRAFDAGDLTVEAYAQSLLSRIQERDADIRAWVYLDHAQVLRDARALDQVPVEKRGPLHGVAVAVKDVIYVKGMPTSHNSPIYANSRPDIDAASIQLLRHAGALILGKTHTTEFAASNIGPPTRNPHNLAHTPGGSSSGSAAAVCDFHVPIALGTQTGGSIIRPASFTGIYGFKPTWNAISREGQKVHSLILDTIGFFSRSIEDMELLCNVFRLSDDITPQIRRHGLPEFTRANIRLAYCKTMVWSEAGPGTQSAFSEGIAKLEAAGITVTQITLPQLFTKLPEFHTDIATHDARTSLLPEYLNSAPPTTLRRFDASTRETSDDEISDETSGCVMQPGPEGAHLDKDNQRWFHRRQNHQKCTRALDAVAVLRPEWDSIATNYDAVIVPSAIDTAPEGLGSTGSHIFNRIWTALHVPVVNIPAFRGEMNGLPIGLSLTTGRFRDRELLRAAKVVRDVWIAEVEVV